tara:strand:+ start:58 stop:492 length:435 start_codon:yes stop_codon:yes gene_type:complete
MKNTERLKELAQNYELTGNDFFKSHQGFIIITRTGIEKIAAIDNMDIKYEMVKCENDFVVIKAIVTKEGKSMESYGESDLLNLPIKVGKNGNKIARYPVALAEKRAKARAVLQLSEFYKYGIYAEVESDEFKRPSKSNSYAVRS